MLKRLQMGDAVFFGMERRALIPINVRLGG